MLILICLSRDGISSVNDKNQFIFFLVPLLFGLLGELVLSKNKFKNFFSVTLIILLAFITVKYHLRFNENRKFHELTKLKLNQSTDAEEINVSLKGLYWKNPHYSDSAQKEIQILKKGYDMINSSENIMLISHYQFFDSITKKKLNSPNKTFTVDGASGR